MDTLCSQLQYKPFLAGSVRNEPYSPVCVTAACHGQIGVSVSTTRPTFLTRPRAARRVASSSSSSNASSVGSHCRGGEALWVLPFWLLLGAGARGRVSAGLGVFSHVGLPGGVRRVDISTILSSNSAIGRLRVEHRS